MSKRTVFADLHLHSTASDGLQSPEEVVSLLYDAGGAALSLTDHDSTAGIEAAAVKAETLGLIFVPGIELSTIVEGHELHILGYGFDSGNCDLQRQIEILRQSRRERMKEMVGKLARLGIDLPLGRVMEKAVGDLPARPHLARTMVEAGYATTLSQAFDRYIGRGKPAYVERYVLPPLQAIALIRAAGGLPVLAHPAAAGDDSLIPRLADAGLAGLEAWHPCHTPRQIRKYADLADDLHLLATGGSDSHGDDHPQHAEAGRYGIDRERFASFMNVMGRNM